MEVADHVADRPRQRAALGGLDLAGVLAQHRRDEGQAERGVDLLLGLARDDLAALDLATARTRSASSPRASARWRSLMLWPFEPVK